MTTHNDKMLLLLRDGRQGLLRIEDAERLQGLPPGWTAPCYPVAKPGIGSHRVAGRGRPSDEGDAHGHRWALLGNAVSAPVARWLGERLATPYAFKHPGVGLRDRRIDALLEQAGAGAHLPRGPPNIWSLVTTDDLQEALIFQDRRFAEKGSDSEGEGRGGARGGGGARAQQQRAAGADGADGSGAGAAARRPPPGGGGGRAALAPRVAGDQCPKNARCSRRNGHTGRCNRSRPALPAAAAPPDAAPTPAKEEEMPPAGGGGLAASGSDAAEELPAAALAHTPPPAGGGASADGSGASGPDTDAAQALAHLGGATPPPPPAAAAALVEAAPAPTPADATEAAAAPAPATAPAAAATARAADDPDSPPTDLELFQESTIARVVARATPAQGPRSSPWLGDKAWPRAGWWVRGVGAYGIADMSEAPVLAPFFPLHEFIDEVGAEVPPAARGNYAARLVERGWELDVELRRRLGVDAPREAANEGESEGEGEGEGGGKSESEGEGEGTPRARAEADGPARFPGLLADEDMCGDIVWARDPSALAKEPLWWPAEVLDPLAMPAGRELPRGALAALPPECRKASLPCGDGSYDPRLESAKVRARRRAFWFAICALRLLNLIRTALFTRPPSPRTGASRSSSSRSRARPLPGLTPRSWSRTRRRARSACARRRGARARGAPRPPAPRARAASSTRSRRRAPRTRCARAPAALPARRSRRAARARPPPPPPSTSSAAARAASPAARPSAARASATASRSACARPRSRATRARRSRSAASAPSARAFPSGGRATRPPTTASSPSTTPSRPSACGAGARAGASRACPSLLSSLALTPPARPAPALSQAHRRVRRWRGRGAQALAARRADPAALGAARVARRRARVRGAAPPRARGQRGPARGRARRGGGRRGGGGRGRGRGGRGGRARAHALRARPRGAHEAQPRDA
jgi:hypothetical protein